MGQTVSDLGRHRAIIGIHQVCFSFQISCSKGKWGETEAKFILFAPVKNMGVVSKRSGKNLIGERSEATQSSKIG